MMNRGNVAIILNAHFPYVRRAGRWPHGEESLHQVIAESYVPLLAMLHDLRAETGGVPLTLALSPILLEQLADPVITKHFCVWLDEWRARAQADLAQFEADNHGHGAYLARFYLDWIDTVERNFVQRFERNLVSSLRRLLRPTAEILLVPATYAYLPHLSAVDVQAQLEIAALVILHQLGQRPQGLWLPNGGSSSSIQATANELGLRYAVGAPQVQTGETQHTAMLPTIHPHSPLAEHVIAPGMGYPGDGVYREFYRDHPSSGLAYWRVTGGDVPLDAKAWYDPYEAFGHVEQHADHFVRALRTTLHAQPNPQPTVVIAFDCDLFGHWWFEGMRWLQSVLQRIHAADDLQLVTLHQARPLLPVSTTVLQPAPHPLFDAPIVQPLRQRIQAASQRLTGVARRRSSADGLTATLLAQAARELVLAQSSDWPALIATGAAQDYAQRRFDEHLARFDQLVHYAEHAASTTAAQTYVREIAELDNPFPFINFRMFA